MKKYLYLFIVTIGLSSCSQNLTCEDFKDGEFKIPSIYFYKESINSYVIAVIQKNVCNSYSFLKVNKINYCCPIKIKTTELSA